MRGRKPNSQIGQECLRQPTRRDAGRDRHTVTRNPLDNHLLGRLPHAQRDAAGRSPPYRGIIGYNRVLLVLDVTGRRDARARLLEVARHRFAVDSVLAATLDEVRREAGVSVGALYHHFPDKSALAAAVYAQVMAEYQAGFITMLHVHATAEGGIRGGVAHHLRWVATHRAEAALLLGDRLDSTALRESNREFFAAVRNWWRPHESYRALRPMQPGITAALWFGPAQEFSRHWLASTEPNMPRGAVKAFADAAWSTLRANDREKDNR